MTGPIIDDREVRRRERAFTRSIIDLMRHELERVAVIDGQFRPAPVDWRIDVIERALLTGGPSMALVNLDRETFVSLTVAHEPASDTFTVWTRGSSWSGLTRSRLREAIEHFAEHGWR